MGEGPWFPIEAEGRLIDLRGRLKLGSLVTVLDRAERVLSTDSGPAHIARGARSTGAGSLRRNRLAQDEAVRGECSYPYVCAILFSLPKTDVLEGYTCGMHESVNSTKDSDSFAVACLIKASNNNRIRKKSRNL